MKVGVISDTHGYLDPLIPGLFQGVDHILHAGDICGRRVIDELEGIAPVTAVLGNNDDPAFGWRELEVVKLGGRTFLLHHIVDPHQPTDRLNRAYLHHSPDIVVFGHTHRPHHEYLGERLFFNPGYAGRPRFGMARTVAVLDLSGPELTAKSLALD